MQSEIRRAAEHLRRGGLVIVPTETVYGLAADPRAAGSEASLREVKGREEGKPVALLAKDLEQVEAYGAILGPAARRLAARYWPGPLTLVLPAGMPGEGGTQQYEGFRVPDHPMALALLDEVGGVLRVTSANLSGEPPAVTADEAREALDGQVNVVLDAGPAEGGVPSTVVKTEGELVEVLREGAIPATECHAT